MTSIPSFTGNVTGTTGTANTLEPKSGYRVYVLKRGAFASAASSGALITFDSADAASRYAANDWIQVGTDTATLRQVSAVGGNSIGINSAVTVALNDRIFIAGTTQPSVSGGSATYTPSTTIYQRDDDAATPVTNSMLTTDSNGGYQINASQGIFDALVQDSRSANVGYVLDVPLGVQPGNLIPDSARTRDIGSPALPWDDIFYAGKIWSGVTSGVGATSHKFDTIAGVTQGNLWSFGNSGTVTVYGDTKGGVQQAWNLSTMFNPKSAFYGAKGDGAADDTTAIQNALNDAAAGVAGTSGGLVFLPRGTYIVNTTLTIPTKVRLMGEGRNATTIKAGGSFIFNGSTDAVIRQGSATENAHGTWLEDLTVDCNNIANSIGVYSTRLNEPSGARRFAVSRARLYGIFYSTINSQNWSIRDCEIYMSDSASVATSKGIYVDACAGAMIMDRITLGTYSGTGTVIGAGIHLAHTGGHIPAITNCHFEGCAVGVRQSANDARISCISGHNTTTVLFARDAGIVNAVIDSLYSGGSPTGISDSLTGTTAGGAIFFVESNGLQTVLDVSSATGNSWTIPHPISHSGYLAQSGTALLSGIIQGNSMTILTQVGGSITLAAGYFQGISGTAQNVTAINPLTNGRLIMLQGVAGAQTFADTAGLDLASGLNKTLNAGDRMAMHCIGSTWYQTSAIVTS